MILHGAEAPVHAVIRYDENVGKWRRAGSSFLEGVLAVVDVLLDKGRSHDNRCTDYAHIQQSRRAVSDVGRGTVSSRGSPAPTAKENLAGLVERVTFQNDDSGFCVLRVKARGQRDLITVVGHAAAIGAGEFVQASGRWVNDRTHGVQFRADFLRAAPPTTAEGVEKYLASGMIKGIGPIYAKKLVKAFKEQVFD
ncbi:MAG: YrrC family ATP-dependent DNA helicase, partial [Rhodospirillales bacterium]